MKRRTFLATTTVGLFAAASRAAEEARQHVTSDSDTLRRVLVHAPCATAWWPLPEEDVARAFLFDDERWTEETARKLWTEGTAQHRELVELLTGNAVEVLFLDRLLDDAIVQCRKAGRFGDWVLKNVPALADTADRVDAAALVESAPYPIAAEAEAEGEPEPLPLRWIFYTRDVATMTPRGLVLGRFLNEDRGPEPALLRLALNWSPDLRGTPIAFDAARENVNLQGGDLLVVDDKTVFLGVGSLTDAAAAPKLARALKMDVVSVQLPGGTRTIQWYGLRKLFLHLDTVLGLLGPKTAVTLPFVFESKFSDRPSLEQITRACRKQSWGDAIDFRKTMRVLRDIGRVRRFAAGTGEPDPKVEGMKLVDYLRSTGYELIFVGGTPPRAADSDFLHERFLPELRAQAANVVALGPRRLIAYSGNQHTLGALRAAGIDVQTFRGSALARWHGGPHCLTLPLQRV